MSRYPDKAIRESKETAEKRGEVQHYARAPGCIAHFSIVSPHMLAEVFMKPVRHIRSTVRALLREAAHEIAGLKIFPSSPQISRELWISSPKYFRRYFRVCDTGLIELGPDGQPLPAGSPATGPRRPRAGAAAAPAPAVPAEIFPVAPGSPASPAPGVPAEISPVTPGSPELPVPGSPAGISPAAEVPAPESSGPESPASSASPAAHDPAAPGEVPPALAPKPKGAPSRGSAHT